MTKQQDNQLLDDLFTGLKDFLNTPLPGTETSGNQKTPQSPVTPAVEEESLLEKLKEIFETSLPGTSNDSADSESAKTPVPVQPVEKSETKTGIEGWSHSDEPVQQEPKSWSSLQQRHARERDEQLKKHRAERKALQKKHQHEREELSQSRMKH